MAIGGGKIPWGHLWTTPKRYSTTIYAEKRNGKNWWTPKNWLHLKLLLTLKVVKSDTKMIKIIVLILLQRLCLNPWYTLYGLWRSQSLTHCVAWPLWHPEALIPQPHPDPLSRAELYSNSHILMSNVKPRYTSLG